MIDAMWTFYQHNFPEHSKIWSKNHKYRIIGYNTPRYWYIDNTNLERCGLKIKYDNIFPKEVSLKPLHPHNGGVDKAGGEHYRVLSNNYHHTHNSNRGDIDLENIEEEDDEEENDRNDKDEDVEGYHDDVADEDSFIK